jgi:hypothetical protein
MRQKHLQFAVLPNTFQMFDQMFDDSQNGPNQPFSSVDTILGGRR